MFDIKFNRIKTQFLHGEYYDCYFCLESEITNFTHRSVLSVQSMIEFKKKIGELLEKLNEEIK